MHILVETQFPVKRGPTEVELDGVLHIILAALRKLHFIHTGFSPHIRNSMLPARS
jgi:hypothetical protein